MAVYIASDLHLGAPNPAATRTREKHFIEWLDHIRHDAEEIILLGDLFDFWFEYRHYINRHHIRLIGKLAELRDAGIPITFFPGNHDFWTLDFFQKELDIPVIHGGQTREYYGSRFYLHHGDCLGPGDYVFKVVRYVIDRRWFKWAYRLLPADLGFLIADYYMSDSRRRSERRGRYKHDFGEKELLLQWTRSFRQQDTSHDFFVFGHRHHAKFKPIGDGGYMIVLGEWISKHTYLRIDEEHVQLLRFHPAEPHAVIGRKRHRTAEAEVIQEVGL